jgi:hypothetical protein
MQKFFKGGVLMILIGSFGFGSLFISSTPAYAGGYLTLDTFSGHPGQTVVVSGGGWTSGDTVAIFVGGSSTQLATATVGSDTNFSTTIVIPANEPQGSLTVTGIDQTNHFTTGNSYYVVPLTPAITVSTASHTPYATVSVHGTGFAPNEPITLSLAGATGSTTADSAGAFTGTIIVPQVSSSLYHLIATGNSSNVTAFDYFWIDAFYPNISPSSYYVLPGATLSFTGTGFAPGETVNVTQAGATSTLSTIVAGPSGAFTSAGGFSVPISDQNTIVHFTLVGTHSGVSASTGVTIGGFFASITPSSYYVVPNSSLTITGAGFAPGESIAFLVNGTTASSTATANSFGAFTAPVLIPFGTGSASIQANGIASRASASVTVTLASFYPQLTPSVWFAYPGQTVTYTGTGFVPNETVTMTVGTATTTSTFTTDSTGTFTSSPVTIAFTGKDTLTTAVIGSLSLSRVTNRIAIGRVSPYLSADSYSVTQGGIVHVQGVSFGAGETVHVTAGTFSTDVITDASGQTPMVAITTPYGRASLPVTFTGASTGATASLTVHLNGYFATLNSSSYYAQPGTNVTLTGNGFSPNEAVTITSDVATTTTTASALGAISTTLALPLADNDAADQVTATGVTSGASASLSIAYAPFLSMVTPSTYYALPGTNVNFTGTGFAPGENIAMTFNGNSVIGPITTSTTGGFTFGYMLPYGVTTGHAVFTGALSEASSTVDITLASFFAYISLNNYYGNGGTPLTVSGSGFAANEPVSLAFAGTGFATTTADSHGAISYSGSVPYAPAGTTPLKATGANSAVVAGTTFTVAQIYPNLTLGSYAGKPGAAINFVGSGYLPNETLSLALSRTSSSTPTTAYTFSSDSSGNFNDSGFVVPTDFTEGVLVLTLTGNHSFAPKSITYYVTGN